MKKRFTDEQLLGFGNRGTEVCRGGDYAVSTDLAMPRSTWPASLAGGRYPRPSGTRFGSRTHSLRDYQQSRSGCGSSEGSLGSIALTSQAKREAVGAMREQTGISQRRACLLVKLSRRVLNYTSKVRPENGQLQSGMVELASERCRFGYWRSHALLRREGIEVNHKRIFRLYQAAGLAVARRKKQCSVAVEREPLALPVGQMQYGQWI